MSCCGNKRLRFAGPAPASTRATPPPATFRAPVVRRADMFFEYVGRTALTVTGPVTGLRYRFSASGARLAVDAADQPSMAKLPQLRRIAHP